MTTGTVVTMLSVNLLVSLFAALPHQAGSSVPLTETHIGPAALVTLASNSRGWDWSSFDSVQLTVKNESRSAVTVCLCRSKITEVCRSKNAELCRSNYA